MLFNHDGTDIRRVRPWIKMGGTEEGDEAYSAVRRVNLLSEKLLLCYNIGVDYALTTGTYLEKRNIANVGHSMHSTPRSVR